MSAGRYILSVTTFGRYILSVTTFHVRESTADPIYYFPVRETGVKDRL